MDNQQMQRKNKRRGVAAALKRSSKYVTMLALVLALGVAVYLNWRFSGIEANATLGKQPDDTQQEHYGDAMFVSGQTDGTAYFASARLSRTESRDAALDSLQKALQDTELTEAEKSELTAKLTAVAKNITAEANIESLIKAKGFSDCVVYISDGAAKIVVSCADGELNAGRTAQIVEIVKSQSDIPAHSISIVEVKK